MRLAILSDVHGNLAALEAVLADVRTRAPDVVVNLGDCATSPLWPRETVELLATLALPTVRGNHDRWIATAPPEKLSRSERFTHDALTAEQRATLGALPPSVRVSDDVLAVHGSPRSDVEYLLEEKVDGRLALARPALLRERLEGVRGSLVLCGHSHHQHCVLAPGGRLVVNPGSVGFPRYADNEDRPTNEAGSPHARYALATRRGGRWSVELVVLDYDWSVVVERARQNGRPDWAAGFINEEAESG
jgi:predicted phosphodiesterase